MQCMLLMIAEQNRKFPTTAGNIPPPKHSQVENKQTGLIECNSCASEFRMASINFVGETHACR